MLRKLFKISVKPQIIKRRTSTEIITELFNMGKLKASDAQFYHKLGHDIICKGSKVSNIVPPIGEV